MKQLFLLAVIAGLAIAVNGQEVKKRNLDSLLKNISHDTSEVNFLLDASLEVSFYNVESGRDVAERALRIARELHYTKGEATALNDIGETFHLAADYPQALKFQFEALQINRDTKDLYGEAETLGLIGIVYNELGQFRQALQTLKEAVTIFQEIHRGYNGSFELSNIGDAYYSLGMPDSGFYYQKKAYEAFIAFPTGLHLQSFIWRHMGDAYAKLGKTDSALKFYNEAIVHSLLSDDKMNASMTQNAMAAVFESIHQYDSAIDHAHVALEIAKAIGAKLLKLNASNLLAKIYKERRNPDSAFFYLDMAMATKDSLYGPEKIRQMQLLMLDEQQKHTTLERKNEQYRNRIRYITLVSGAGVFLLLAFLLWRNNRHKKRSNDLLQKEKQNVEKAYEELKSTQAQLIQSEKMASLGELTAGIAHEIQNPLNFVNNFSEVNKEMIDEATEEIGKGNYDEVKTILNDIKVNSEKINHHGKRADAIVKGMLQHSKTSTGKKEPTDINKLADEYLRLAYHGMRAKDKSFEVDLQTDFDESVGKLNVVTQDIGRVLLNLYNNAFYACAERSQNTVTEKHHAIVNEEKSEKNNLFQPTVWVTTKREENSVTITVRDNGSGIPDSVKEKIFQPFFTTKPTGVGTGLGLSLSYDIIKAHGGEIRVETKQSEGTKFIIELPIA